VIRRTLPQCRRLRAGYRIFPENPGIFDSDINNLGVHHDTKLNSKAAAHASLAATMKIS